ncbi:MAG: cadherin domain-containing protein [Kiloniellaceae bacterium]
MAETSILHRAVPDTGAAPDGGQGATPAPDPSAGAGLGGAGDVLVVEIPAEATRVVYSVRPDQLVGARFDPAAARSGLEDGSLVFAFANGGEIVLEGFAAAAAAGRAPSLIFADGSVLSAGASPDRTAMLDGGLDLGLASGSALPAPADVSVGVIGGVHGYDDDFGRFLDGLQATGALLGASTPGRAPLGAGLAGVERGPAPATAGLVPPGPATPGSGPGDATDDVNVVAGPRALAANLAPASPANLAPALASAANLAQAPAPAAAAGPGAPPAPAPASLTLRGGAVDEGSPLGALVGVVATDGAAPGAAPIYSLLDDAGGLFTIDAATGAVRVAGNLDYEAATQHRIVARSTDPGGDTIDEAFTITINDLSEIPGGANRDTLRGTGADELIDGRAGNDKLFGGGGDDILLGGDGKDRISGEAGDDILIGDAGNDRLTGGPGADWLLGGAGNDRLFIDADDPVIRGGAGTDRVDVQGAAGVSLDLTATSVETAYGNVGDDTFDATGMLVRSQQFARDGDDRLIGGEANDQLFGEGGDDVLVGNGGNDQLVGGAGADRLFGGAGNDRLFIDADDPVIDGGAGTDRVDVQGGVGVSLDLAAASVETAFGGSGDDTFDAGGVSVATRLVGLGGDDRLTGGAGADRLQGGDGDDVLAGGAGNDRLEGGKGDDGLLGGPGNDTLRGDAGADTFAFALSVAGGKVGAQGKDKVSDFTTSDTLTLSGVLDINGDGRVDLGDLSGHLTVNVQGSRVTLLFDGGGSIELQGLDAGTFDTLQQMIDAGYDLQVTG